MATITAHGIGAESPRGWDGEIYERSDEVVVVPDLRGPSVLETATPILHLANFGLPAVRGDYGGGAVEIMGSGGIFISVLEHPSSEAGLALFAGKKIPWPLSASDFQPNQMQRAIPGQAGCQRFFSTNGRAFCLYVAIGSYNLRAVLVREVNAALATVQFT